MVRKTASLIRVWNRKRDEPAQSTAVHLLHAMFAVGGLMTGQKNKI